MAIAGATSTREILFKSIHNLSEIQTEIIGRTAAATYCVRQVRSLASSALLRTVSTLLRRVALEHEPADCEAINVTAPDYTHTGRTAALRRHYHHQRLVSSGVCKMCGGGGHGGLASGCMINNIIVTGEATLGAEYSG